MLPRERITNAINFKSVDIVPLRIFPAPGGLYEHGQKLVDMIKELGHDFGPLDSLTMPKGPLPDEFDSDGRYHTIKMDDWGTTWEYRIFGIWGHSIVRPLDDISKLDQYKPPLFPQPKGEGFEKEKLQAFNHKKNYYLLGEGGSLFEKLHSLRRFEEVLMDVTLNTKEINHLADVVIENIQAHISKGLALNVDSFAFGDDFGTQSSMIFSLKTWRDFFKPRYKNLFKSIKQAGKKVFFHSCGKIEKLFEDFKEIGVDVIWPQLPVYDLPELAKHCRHLNLAIELHPDRGDLMQKASPDAVQAYIHNLIDTFDVLSGGSWLYIEIDPGFPWKNVETLVKTAMKLREQV